MIKQSHRIKTFILFVLDIVVLYTALVGELYVRYASTKEGIILMYRHFLPFSLVFIFWLAMFGAFGLYDLRLARNDKNLLYRLLGAMGINLVLAIIIFYLIPFKIEPRRNLFIIAGVAIILLLLGRYIFNMLIVRTRAARVLFWGISAESIQLAQFLLHHPQLGQKPVAFMSPDANGIASSLPVPYFTSDQKLLIIINDYSIDTIVIAREVKENKMLVRMLFEVLPMGVAVVEFPAYHEMLTGKVPLSLIGEVWFLENLIGIRKPFYNFFKRIIDIAIALLLAIPTAVLAPFIIFAIKLDSRGSAFFTQHRVGKNGKEFLLIKFRSMVEHADRMPGLKTNGASHDPRHTRVGAFLRKNYLDELPQIINILRGEMSIIGPRPERPHYVNELRQKIPFYEIRLLVPPGITGWAQVHMENDASVEDAPEKLQYDLYYIKNRTPMLDLSIILRTVFTLIRRDGR